MMAVFMEVLDTSIANIALPHIAGSLSATTDEATWVLTSYLVSNAIILPMTGWLGNYFGRKRGCFPVHGMFTFASVLCGLAWNLPTLILARILQGIGGGAMVPIAQAVLLESFPVAKRGVAMATFSMGVIVAPILGPTLGGWITDNYSWRWIFYINLPVGIAGGVPAEWLVEDPPYIKRNLKAAIDFIGFGLLAVWLATLQITLDKGQEEDWFQSNWICWFGHLGRLH
jgi:DHA2 family multidrug resistance protein